MYLMLWLKCFQSKVRLTTWDACWDSADTMTGSWTTVSIGLGRSSTCSKVNFAVRTTP